jgi:SAM-dependent methyltransferase
MTDEMIAKANENIAASGFSNAEVRKGIIEDLPVNAESVDWVISNCVINLSPEKDRVFAEIARVLRPGGRMVVSDIVVEDLPESVRTNPTYYSACVAGAISEAEYVDGLRRAGLEDVEVRERLVYDACQIADLIESETCCCGDGAGEATGAAQSLPGKVWSAQFHARKPLA